ADEAAADIQEDGGSATVVLGDLTDPEQAAQVASLAREHRVDIDHAHLNLPRPAH
ncbi:MAG: hypothetical protein H0V32_12895, partial [Nocardioidaceae bacterium]|nr:hypothetical protein [Nocardioidaceae bacterium]